jgi:hypothetical protein
MENGMITTPSIYTLEREVMRILPLIETLNGDKLALIKSLEAIESEIDINTTWLNGFNKSIEILRNG